MSDQAINKLVDRLEAVAARLEKVEAQLGAGGAGGANNNNAPAAAVSSSQFVTDFNNLVTDNLTKYYAQSEALGNDEVKAQAQAVKRAIDAHAAFINIAAQAKKPDNETLMALLKPTSDAVAEVIKIRDSNRGNSMWNHLSAVSEGIPALGWVTVSPTPGPFANEYKGNSEFYSNKMIREYKGKDEAQMDWVNGWNGFLKGLVAYIKNYHTTELKWNPKGQDPKQFVGAAVADNKPKAAAKPKAVVKKPVAGGGLGGLMADLNKGAAVTKGLNRVTKDMKTKYRDPKDKVAVVKAQPKKPAASKPRFGGVVKKGNPLFELDGNKWKVEWQENLDAPLEITETEVKHTVYIYKCFNSTIVIKGKVNAITLDQCKKVGVCFDNAIAVCEMVNCNSVQVQCTGKVPSFTIDKCSGAQVYLSKECLDAEIVTSKSDEMNVVIPGEEDIIELAVPEQFKTTVVNGALVTNNIEHV
jgi:adenylyl cyclase-associated protein